MTKRYRIVKDDDSHLPFVVEVRATLLGMPISKWVSMSRCATQADAERVVDNILTPPTVVKEY